MRGFWNRVRKLLGLRKLEPPSVLQQFYEWRNRHPNATRCVVSPKDYMALKTELVPKMVFMLPPPNEEAGIWVEGVIVQRNSSIGSGFWEK